MTNMQGAPGVALESKKTGAGVAGCVCLCVWRGEALGRLPGGGDDV